MVEKLKERWPLFLFGLLVCGALALAFPHAISALYLEAGGRAMDDPAQAVAHLQEALEWDGANAQAFRLLGRAYLALGQNEAALEALSQASALRPKNPLLHMELAQAYEAWGRAPGEDPDLDRQAAREWMVAGLNVDKLLDQGEKYRQEGFPDEALVWFERAMRLEPDSGDPWYYVGLARGNQGDYEGALAAYERALDLGRLERVGESEPHCRMGIIIRWNLEPPNLAEALEVMDKAMALADFRFEPTEAQCHYSYGQMLRETNADPQQYITEFERATNLDPNHVWAHILLGLSLYEAFGDAPQAEAELLTAIKLAPELPAPVFHLAFLYEREGRIDDAKAMYEKVLALDSDYTAARERMKALTEGQ